MITVGQSIRALRLEKRWTQKELSDKTKIKQGIISAYENDKYSPGVKHLNTIADAFKVSVSVIDERLLNNSHYDRDTQEIIDYFSKEDNRAEKLALLLKIEQSKNKSKGACANEHCEKIAKAG